MQPYREILIDLKEIILFYHKFLVNWNKQGHTLKKVEVSPHSLALAGDDPHQNKSDQSMP